MRKPRKRMTKGEAYKLLLIGIIMGTVFIFGGAYFNKTVKPSETIPVNATYISHKESFRPFWTNRTKGIYIDFSDYDRLRIATECVNDELRMELDEIEKNTKVKILIHPNANTILDMRTSDKTILEFKDVMRELENARKGFFLLGVFCYFSALMGAGRLLEDSRILLWWRRRKKEKVLIEKKNARKDTVLTEEQKLKKMSRKQRIEYKQKNK